MNGQLCAALVGILALPVALFAQAPPSGPARPVVVMQDQFKKIQNVSDFRGAVVVLVYGDRAAANANKVLGEQLHVHFHPTANGLSADKAHAAPVRPLPDVPPGTASPEVRTVPVACIGPVPEVVRSIIRAQFRAQSPVVPVWLDFENRMKQAEFPFTAGLPNFVVLDAVGRLRCAYTGPVGREQFEQLVGVVESLRREAVQAK